MLFLTPSFLSTLIQLPVAIASSSHARIAFARVDFYLASPEYGQALLGDYKADWNRNESAQTTASLAPEANGSISIRQADFEWPLSSSAHKEVVLTPALGGDEASTNLLREVLEVSLSPNIQNAHTTQLGPAF
ncbi:unnamed protein product [Phytophthora lilii]|uniref:Unnamed protein product n=1 Tax=Phytophthora lilii TaxID=2077276 RepID=A0A9W6UDR2_9STRA|nr:unnamed protein product [Phytophthora lilii]